jgi:hypothetical protein
VSDPAGGAGTGGVDVDAVAAAVTACPSVAHLVGGSLGDQVATYLPGRRVNGVRVTDDAVEVHLASRWGVPIPEVAAEVRAAVAPFAAGRPVTVAVDDIDDPRAELPAGSTGAGADSAAGAVPTAVPSPS